MTPPVAFRGASRFLETRLLTTVAACAAVVYLGALWNRWAMDDLPIIATNPLVHSWSGLWAAFTQPYWPAGENNGGVYRPLALASYVLDWQLGSVALFHAVNILWHAGASAAVAALTRRLADARSALIAGLLFAVHPVHVEAVANVVGRAELMTCAFAILAVYAALVSDRPLWSLLAWGAALLSKEEGAVVPALICWGWMAGVGRPVSRARLATYGAGWVAIAAGYFALHHVAFQTTSALTVLAPQFLHATPVEIRLTAVSAFADFARLLVFPLTLRADYSPNERVTIHSPADPAFLAGVLALGIWLGLLIWTWRRGRRVEAFGLGWVGIALAPVANIVFPIGVLVAERTLYLPSVGLVIAGGAALARVPLARLKPIVAIVVVAAGVRTALRVPVWHDSVSMILGVLDDSPRSFQGPGWMIGLYLEARQPEKALQAYRVADSTFQDAPWVYFSGADAALTLGRGALADSILAKTSRLCGACEFNYRYEADIARARGSLAVADSLLARGHSK